MMRSSSEPGEPSTKVIDASVGGLVWVRRRNGSWWPGRIVGLDELSEECLVSPRSGTPVKLLGREDASVDWYNLEKSKRVKAFRCGDYDKCIEKAKASAANANKKAVKYARREDAILHALEIENSLLGEDRPDFCSRIDNSCGEHGKSPTMSRSSNEDENGHADMSDEVNNSADDAKSVMELSQSGASFEEPNKLIPSKDQSMNGRRRKTPNDSEDDGTEGTKRTRGLEDLGMGVVSKRKGLAGLNEVANLDSASLCDPNKADCVSNGSPATGSKTYSSLKRKISQLPNTHEFLRRRNRRCPLTKVLKSTAMVSVPVKCDQLGSVSGSPLRGISDNKLPEIEYNESKDIPVMINSNLNSTVVSCENRVSYNALKHPPDVSHVNSKRENDISGVSGLPENDSSDKLFDVPHVEDDKSSAAIPLNLAPISSGNPENSEVVALNEFHVNDTSRSMDEGTSKWQSKGKRKSRNLSKIRKQDSTKMLEVGDEHSAYLPATEHLNGVSHDSVLKLDCSGTVKFKLAGEDQKDLFPDWSRRRESNARPLEENNGMHNLHKSRPYRQSHSTVNAGYEMSDFPSRSVHQLYDVNLEVKASYRPQHVPLVSLMSKLNGKAIIGHPLTVEALDYGSCDLLTSSFADPKDNLESWYTVKRNSKSERAPAKHLTLQSRYSKSKRKSGLLSKKTRKLSSLTSSHKQGERRKPVVEKLKGPAIACVPLKLVFSRINEAVTRLTHRPSTSSNP